LTHPSKDESAAVDYRGCIEVDEVDGRSPVERAAAAFVPDLRRHCAGRTTKSAVDFFAAVGSFEIKRANRNFHRKICDFFAAHGIDSDADLRIAKCVRPIFRRL
jgi:transcription initiation factor TFIIIB Brf1 subunit/transcription initiation factor TFIIB